MLAPTECGHQLDGGDCRIRDCGHDVGWHSPTKERLRLREDGGAGYRKDSDSRPLLGPF